MMLFSVHVITILFGTNNKEEDDENQERVDDRNTYWEKSSPSEQEEVEETTSVPSRDSRPQRDYSVSEVDGVTHQEITFPTTPPGSVSGGVWGLEDRPREVPVYSYFGSTGSG